MQNQTPFPAQAGMNRPTTPTIKVVFPVPRAGGDEPYDFERLVDRVNRSPRRRG